MSWLLPVYPAELDVKVCEGPSLNHKCRYFATNDNNQPCCLKLDGDYRQVIDEEIEYYLSQPGARIGVIQGTYQLGEHLPLGDNCPGVEMNRE